MNIPFGQLEGKVVKINENSIEVSFFDAHIIEISNEFVKKADIQLNETVFYQIVERNDKLFQEIV